MELGRLRNKLRAGAMSLLAAGAMSAGFAGLTATAAHAATDGPTGGSFEICKTSVTGTLAVVGSFSFTVTGGGQTKTVSVAVNGCSAPISINGSVATITEASSPAYSVVAITAAPGGNYIVPGSINLPLGQVKVALSANTTSTVFYENTIDPGYVEVCKYAAASSGLSGSFSFNVAGADGWLNGAPASANAKPITVGVGACSDPLEMPAGSVTTTEAGTNLYVTGIEANESGSVNSAILTDSTVAGTATVAVAASTNPSDQTIVAYTDDVVAYKVCKNWGYGVEPGGSSELFPFTFAVSAGDSSASGPYAAAAPQSGSFSLPVGGCEFVGSYPAGTIITTTEGAVPGTKVESIDDWANDGAESILSGPTGVVETSADAAQLAAGQITYILGTPVDSSQATPGNEVTAGYTDMAADPGQLKICKYAGSVPPVGTSFTFTYSGLAYTSITAGPGGTWVGVGPIVTATGTVSVPLGNCVLVGGTGTGGFTPFLYNGAVSVQETGLAATDSVSAIAANPLFVQVDVWGYGPTVTTVPTLTASSLTAGTSTVTIGEDYTTELSYTDIDPPLTTSPVVTSPVGVIVTSPVGTSTGGVTVPSTGVSLVTVNNVPTIENQGKPLTRAQDKALLKKDDKSLTSIKAQITKWQKLATKAHGSARRKDLAKVFQLKLQERALNAQIKAINLALKG